MSDDDDLSTLKGDEKIVAEAKKRFKKCEDWEENARRLFIDDMQFVNGDSDNNYQWPAGILSLRGDNNSPCLTINKTAKHCDMIINDGKQNKASVSIRPVGDEASFEGAQVYEDIVHHIEYISNAQAAYQTAAEFQVRAGWGYLRLATEYVHDDTFDQEIFIRRVKDPLSIYIDPDCSELDASDARYAFAFDDMARDEYNAEYPDHKDEATTAPLDNTDTWNSKNHVRVAEYFRRKTKPDELISFTDPMTGEDKQVRASRLKADPVGKEMIKALKEHPDTKLRDIISYEVEYFKIAGDKIIERNTWAGKYIPLVPVIGIKTVINGQMDCKGHTRAMKDAQRMYNYMSSAAVEFVALQGKSPWVTPIRAVEGLETYWNNANRANHAYLPYNDVDDEGRPIERPERAAPPQSAPAFLQGMQTAQQELMMVSGQYQAQMGENENAKSGKAIGERQRQGDNATYHFLDNQAMAMRHVGRMLIDLIPKIYDTQRVLKIRADDGTEKNILIDPTAQQAYLQKQQQSGEQVQAIFNPNLGKYGVQADVGPSYSTKRQEAFNAFERIMSSSPELVAKAGDLMFRTADFPLADELAERLKRGVPPELLGEGPPPAVVQLQGHLQNMQAIMAKLVQENAEQALKLKGKDQQKDIDAYDAESRRITALGNAPPAIAVDLLRGPIQQVVREMMGTPIGAVTAAGAPALAADAQTPSLGSAGPSGGEPPPIEGARKAPDGEWYVKHPSGQYFRVDQAKAA